MSVCEDCWNEARRRYMNGIGEGDNLLRGGAMAETTIYTYTADYEIEREGACPTLSEAKAAARNVAETGEASTVTRLRVEGHGIRRLVCGAFNRSSFVRESIEVGRWEPVEIVDEGDDGIYGVRWSVRWTSIPARGSETP